MMHYTNTDPVTGTEIVAEHQQDATCTVTVTVPPYDGTDDAEALKMQVRAARQLIYALDVVAKAVSDTREEPSDP